MCEDLFSSYALNATERLVLSDLNYSLLGISSPELLDANMAEIEQCIAAERGYFSARP